MENNYEALEFKYNKSDGRIISIRVDFGGTDNSVVIKDHFIRELDKANLLSECNKEIFFIIAKAILLKKENSKAIDGCGFPYKLGNKEEFPRLFIMQLRKILYKHYVPIETLVSFFEEGKVEDLNIFINHPSELEFLTFEEDFDFDADI